MTTKTLTIGALAIALTSHAADPFAGRDFSLRYPAALTHFEPYADVEAKGGASAASLFGSSNNPAAIPWRFPDTGDAQREVGLSSQYTNVAFDNGTQLNFLSDSATFGTKETGIFRVDAGWITSNERPVRDLPADFAFDLWGVRLNYARMITDDLSLGASIGYARSETEFKAPGLGFDFADSNKNIWNMRLGGIWSPVQNWLIGLNTTYNYGPADTTTLTPTPLGLIRGVSSDTTHQYTLQPGIAYQLPNTLALIHLDYQLAYFTNSTGHLSENRFMSGFDVPVAKFLFLRAGAFSDVHGNAGWTTGIGFYPSKHVFIDLAYQNDAFPEVKQEFGRSRTLNASVSVQW